MVIRNKDNTINLKGAFPVLKSRKIHVSFLVEYMCSREISDAIYNGIGARSGPSQERVIVNIEKITVLDLFFDNCNKK